MKGIRTIRACGRLAGTMLVLAYCLGRLIILSALFGYREKRGFLYRRKFTGAALQVLGVKEQVAGKPHPDTALYVSNHRSLVDPLVQLRYIDAYVVSKAEVEKYPLVGRGARETGVIFVHRQDTSSRIAARAAIGAALSEGKSILIYPEGTTSAKSTTQEFKRGSFEVAHAHNVPVVPVAIDYADRNDYWHDMPMVPFFLRKFGKRRTRVEMHIGDPISADNPEEMMKQSRHWINCQIVEMRNNFTRK